MRATLLAVAVGAASLMLAVEADAAEHRVEIRDFAYSPTPLNVAVGDTVIFSNHDPVPHTVTDRAGAFDSGQIESGSSWTFTATQAGEFTYYCTLHPRMEGNLAVK